MIFNSSKQQLNFSQSSLQLNPQYQSHRAPVFESAKVQSGGINFVGFTKSNSEIFRQPFQKSPSQKIIQLQNLIAEQQSHPFQPNQLNFVTLENLKLHKKNPIQDIQESEKAKVQKGSKAQSSEEMSQKQQVQLYIPADNKKKSILKVRSQSHIKNQVEAEQNKKNTRQYILQAMKTIRQQSNPKVELQAQASVMHRNPYGLLVSNLLLPRGQITSNNVYSFPGQLGRRRELSKEKLQNSLYLHSKKGYY